MNNFLPIDLSLQPAMLDLWHVCLMATVAVLLLIVMALSLRLLTRKTPEPQIKIIEVEKLVPQPAPEPVILKEATPDAALQLLSLLQKEARFIDFIQENMTAYQDADIGIAARVVHEGCVKALKEHFTLEPVRTEQEGDRITLAEGFDARSIRLTGHIVGSAPFTGTLVHKGWKVTRVNLPKLTQGHEITIIASAEIEL